MATSGPVPIRATSPGDFANGAKHVDRETLMAETWMRGLQKKMQFIWLRAAATNNATATEQSHPQRESRWTVQVPVSSQDVYCIPKTNIFVARSAIPVPPEAKEVFDQKVKSLLIADLDQARKYIESITAGRRDPSNYIFEPVVLRMSGRATGGRDGIVKLSPTIWVRCSAAHRENMQRALRERCMRWAHDTEFGEIMVENAARLLGVDVDARSPSNPAEIDHQPRPQESPVPQREPEPIPPGPPDVPPISGLKPRPASSFRTDSIASSPVPEPIRGSLKSPHGKPGIGIEHDLKESLWVEFRSLSSLKLGQLTLQLEIEELPADLSTAHGILCRATVRHGLSITSRRMCRIGGFVNVMGKPQGVTSAHGVLGADMWDLAWKRIHERDVADLDESVDKSAPAPDPHTTVQYEDITSEEDHSCYADFTVSPMEAPSPTHPIKWVEVGFGSFANLLGLKACPSVRLRYDALKGISYLGTTVEFVEDVLVSDFALVGAAGVGQSGPLIQNLGYFKADDIPPGRVRICLGPRANVDGELLEEPTMLEIGGVQINTRLIELAQPLALGSSGAWVLRGDTFCGMIIAGYENEPFAHMLSGKQLASDIESSLPRATRQSVSPENETGNLGSVGQLIAASALCVILTFVCLERNAVAVAAPSIATGFGRPGDISWYASSYYFASHFSGYIWGLLHGGGALDVQFFVAFVMFLGGWALSVSRPYAIVFIAGRVLTGIGACGLHSVCSLALATILPRHRHETFFELLGISSGFASVIALVRGEEIMQALDWKWYSRVALLLSAAIWIIVLAAARNQQRPPPFAARRLSDLLESFGDFFIPTLALCMYLLLQSSTGSDTYGWSDYRLALGYLPAGLLLLVFIALQTWWQGQNSIIPSRSARRRSIGCALLFAGCIRAGSLRVVYWLSILQALD